MKITTVILFLSLFSAIYAQTIVVCDKPFDSPLYYTSYCETTGTVVGYYVDRVTCKYVNSTCPPKPDPVPAPATLIIKCPNGCPSPAPDAPNYLCADKTLPYQGGPYCNQDTCLWANRDCLKLDTTPRSGYCPFSEPKQCITVNKPCSWDSECADGQKCCDDSCGVTCKASVSTYVKPGNCPVLTGGIGICPITCDSDAACIGDQKCCTNDCGGKVCSSPVSDRRCTDDQCLTNSNLDVTASASIAVCPDGTIRTRLCANITGTCQFVYSKCNEIPPVVRPGYCPILPPTTITTQFADKINCSHTCEQDNNCEAGRKCCYFTDKVTNCGEIRVCAPIQERKCLVGGYRKMRCFLSDLLPSLYPNGYPTEPENGNLLPELCYRCIEGALCGWRLDRNECGWNDYMAQCLEKCAKIIQNSTIPDPCASRGPCQCLEQTANGCVWCQTEVKVVDSTSTVIREVPWGVCMKRESCNKCTLSRDTGGFSGAIVFDKPTNCDTLTSTDKDPSLLISDDRIKKIISEVVNGDFTEASLQEILTDLGIKDVIIDIVGQATTDGKKGRIQITITVTSTRTKDEIIADINKALSNRFSIEVSLITTNLEQTDGTTVKKRGSQQAGSSSFTNYGFFIS